MHMADSRTCAAQCRNALGRYVDPDNFRVVVLEGTGRNPRFDADVELVRKALHELGFSGQRGAAEPGLNGR